MSQLIYQRLWWILGGAWLCIIVFLSLANLSLPQVELTYGDKLNHLLAYGFLMGWFGQLTTKERWLTIAALLMLTGAIMEVIQGMTPHRWFDLRDAAANCIGVLLALLALRAGADQLLSTVERWLVNKGD